MSKRRTEIWVALIVGVVCLIPAAILGLWVYVSVTATPLHPDPRDVPSVTHRRRCQSGPTPWNEGGRSSVRV